MHVNEQILTNFSHFCIFSFQTNFPQRSKTRQSIIVSYPWLSAYLFQRLISFVYLFEIVIEALSERYACIRFSYWAAKNFIKQKLLFFSGKHLGFTLVLLCRIIFIAWVVYPVQEHGLFLSVVWLFNENLPKKLDIVHTKTYSGRRKQEF